jgi:methylated-DNA-[protein]-cysteine S-methyltransferase
MNDSRLDVHDSRLPFMLLLHSPIGLLLVEYTPEAVTGVRFWRQGDHPPAGARDAAARTDPLGRQIERELKEYFDGERRRFELPVRLTGTAFQLRVWKALQQVPCGQTRTYAQLAAELGSPGGARAIGQANRANAVPIIVPCHRVIAAGGALGGYGGAVAGAGVEVKRWLLEHERRYEEKDVEF